MRERWRDSAKGYEVNGDEAGSEWRSNLIKEMKAPFHLLRRN